MNLAIVSDVFPPKCGGSGWSSFYLARALQQRGHLVKVVVPRESAEFGHSEREYEGLTVTEFLYPARKLPFVRNYSRNEALYPRFAAFLTGFFRQHAIELAHGQHYLTIPPAIQAARALAIPSVATIRDYWPVCYWTTHLNGDKVCPGCSELNRLKCLYGNQGAAGLVAAPVSLYMGANLKLKQSWLAQADRVLAVSRYIETKLTPFVEPNRLEVLPNFIDLAKLETSGSSLPLTPEAAQPYLLFVGKFEENKGARQLLEVLRQARPNLPTLAVGEGKLRGELGKATAEGLNLKVLGWVENEEVLRLMQRAEALLFPSLWPEPLSRVLLEAQAVGALTVAVDTGGTSDIIQSGFNGLLAQNARDMAAQLSEILQPELASRRAAMRQNARQVAQERFSQTAIVDRVEKLYTDLIHTQRG